MSRYMLCVASDTTPSNVLRKLISQAARAGLSTDIFLLDGNPRFVNPSSIETKVRNSDIVVIGMSSASTCEVEVEAARWCVKLNKRFGFFADTHGAWRREQFAEFRLKANFLMVVSDDEQLAALTTWPVTKITTTGNPQWAAYFEPTDREAARALLPALSNEFVVFAPGTKDKEHNLTVWRALIRAADMVRHHLIVLSRHPGDTTDHAEYFELQILAKSTGVRMLWFDGKSEELLPGVDVVINGTSLRTFALAQLIPVIDYFEESSQDWLERDIGTRYGYFYDSGAVIDVYEETWVDLAAALNVVRQYPTILRSKQSMAVTRLNEQESLARMLEAALG